MLQALLLHGKRSLGSVNFCPGRLLGSQVLVDLLGAQGAGGLQRARALGIAAGIKRIGLGFRQASAGLGYIGLHALRCKSCQHLAGPHHIPDVGPHRQQAKAIGFAAHDGFLPRRDVAICGELDRQIPLLGHHCGHREGGFGRCRPGTV